MMQAEGENGALEKSNMDFENKKVNRTRK